MDDLMDVLSLSAICKRDDAEPDNWWFCTKCNRKLMDGEYHKKYCNSTKEKHKHKLTKDHTKQFVKDGCCFRCGRKDHYILDCTYPKIYCKGGAKQQYNYSLIGLTKDSFDQSQYINNQDKYSSS